MRDLPSARLLKAADYVPNYRHAYDVVDDQSTLGHVIRELGPGSRSDQRPWRAYLLRTDGMAYRGLLNVKGTPFRTRQEALIAVLHAWQAQEAELEAHAMEGAVQAGVRMAERHAVKQATRNPGHRLTATQYRDHAFSVSTKTVTEELETERNDLRNRLTGHKPAEIWYLQHNAYMVRMYELEIERRQGAQQDVGFDVAPRVRMKPSGLTMKKATVVRCEAQARKGTGTGTCDAVLDEYGNCRYVDNHIEEN